MNSISIRLTVVAWFAIHLTTFATVRYVDVNNATPAPPYISWAGAATNIQDAIDAANVNDVIMVTNGVYATGGKSVFTRNPWTLLNRVALTKAVKVQSVNGPQYTVIQGGSNSAISTIRCAYLADSASLSGFTLTNGATIYTDDPGQMGFGGGVYAESKSATISNCIITRCSAWAAGGAWQGTFFNCTISSNAAFAGGAGASNLFINCLLEGNRADYYGGGVLQGDLSSCIVRSNTCLFMGGATAVCAMTNCLVIGNLAAYGGGAHYSEQYNCTMVANTATSWGGGITGGYLKNCILYFNTATNGANYPVDGYPTYLDNCCTFPAPATNGVGNIPNVPLFVNQAAGDFHLQATSPCINAGKNKFAAISADLDGSPRISGGSVDIGVYEFQSPSSTLSYAWAQLYGLPTDESADHTDSDGDGHSNWSEWNAGTVPTNSQSAFQLLMPDKSAIGGIKLTWKSVTNRFYRVERATALTAPPTFMLMASNLPGQVGTTTYTDQSAHGTGPYFYRVGVQP